MALISCPKCGKNISDSLGKCPHCGVGLTVCPECGAKVSVEAQTCPNCGFILRKEEPKPVKQNILNKINIKNPKVIICALLAVIAVVFLCVNISKKQKIAKWEKAYSYAVSSMKTNMTDAELVADLTHDVWANTINHKASVLTNKYTLKEKYRSSMANSTTVSKSYFNEDFNESMRVLFADSTYQFLCSNVKSGRDSVGKTMKLLSDVPAGKESAYSAVSKLHDQYLSMVNCAINPSGSLITYTSAINSASSGFRSAYEKAKLYK